MLAQVCLCFLVLLKVRLCRLAVQQGQFRNQMRRMAGKKQLLQAKPWGILQSASLGNKSQLRDNGLLHQQFYQSSQPYLQLHILCIAFEALHDLRHRQ